MRILALNLYYPPDTSATAKMAAAFLEPLAAKHEVTLICGRPSYDPTERRAWRLWQTERLGGVTVVRVGSTDYPRTQMARRVFNYLSYVALSIPRALFISCDVVLACTAGAWTRDTDFSSSACQLDAPNSSSCPNTYVALAASPAGSCSVDNLRCEYPDHVCVCARSLGGPVELVDAGETWSCNPGTGCPMPRPRLGATCAINNQACTYQSCDFEETCLNGYWNGQEAACATAGGP